ncbi:MAG: hypothetical protein OEZ08_01885 [Betaproteobacteria bacterium]|nr:hypothetical protein [Betaproteobacteria bacterium]
MTATIYARKSNADSDRDAENKSITAYFQACSLAPRLHFAVSRSRSFSFFASLAFSPPIPSAADRM